MAELGLERLPLLDRLAARHPRRRRARSTRRASTSTTRLVDGLLEHGIQPMRDALPLGPAAGARGRTAAGPAGRRRTRSPTTRPSRSSASATASRHW